MAVFPVVLDANVIYGIVPADLLMTTAGRGLYRAHWTEQILDEARRNVIANNPHADPPTIGRRFDLMNRAMPAALIDPPATELVEAMTNNPKDRHVLAAAVSINAEVIVTDNLADFPIESCRPHGVEAHSLDQFVTDLVSLDSQQVWAAIVEMAERRQRPPKSPQQICEILERYTPTALQQLRGQNLA